MAQSHDTPSSLPSVSVNTDPGLPVSPAPVLADRQAGPTNRTTLRFRISLALVLLCLFALIENFEDSAWYVTAPLFSGAFHLSLFQVGWLPVIEAIGVNLLAFPVAVFADRISRKWIMVISLLLWAVWIAAAGLATSFWMLILFRFCLGASFSGYDPASQSSVADHYPPQHRSYALGILNFVENLGIVIGLQVEAVLSSFLGWQQVFFVVAAVAFVAIFIAILFLKDPKRGAFDAQSPPAQSLPLRQAWNEGRVALVRDGKAILRSGVQLAGMFGRATQLGGFLIVTYFFSFFLIQYFGLPNDQAQTIVAAFNALALVGALVGGLLGGRLVRRYGSGFYFRLAGASLVGMAIFFLVALVVSQLNVVIVLTMISGFLMGVAVPPLATMVGDVNAADRRSFAYAFQTQPTWLAGALGVPIIGFLRDALQNLRVALIIAILVVAVAGVVVYVLNRRLGRSAQEFLAAQQGQSVLALPNEGQS